MPLEKRDAILSGVLDLQGLFPNSPFSVKHWFALYFPMGLSTPLGFPNHSAGMPQPSLKQGKNKRHTFNALNISPYFP